MKPALRLLYMPNECVECDQIGPRMAFETLHAEGELSAYQAYSYLVPDKLAVRHADAFTEMLTVARDFRPDVIFIQCTTNTYPMELEYIRQLKGVPGRPRFVLYEEEISTTSESNGWTQLCSTSWLSATWRERGAIRPDGHVVQAVSRSASSVVYRTSPTTSLVTSIFTRMSQGYS